MILNEINERKRAIIDLQEKIAYLENKEEVAAWSSYIIMYCTIIINNLSIEKIQAIYLNKQKKMYV